MSGIPGLPASHNYALRLGFKANEPAPPPGIRMVGGRRMQCKDIPDDMFLDAVRRAEGTANCGWRMRWDVRTELEREIGPVPENLFLAKARRLIARGLMEGCPCGCRGDYVPADEVAGGWERRPAGVLGFLQFARASAAGEAFKGAMQELVTQAGESEAGVAAIRDGIEKMAGLDGIGALMQNVLAGPVQSDGPPWTHTLRQPEPVPVFDADGRPVLDGDGESVLDVPLVPSLTVERQPTFTGVLAYLADGGGRR